MRKLRLDLDGNRNAPHYGVEQSDTINAVVITGGSESTSTVPSDARWVLMSSDNDFYFIINATASVPAADVTNGSASELNPVMRRVDPGDVLHFISDYDCVVTLAYYK